MNTRRDLLKRPQRTTFPTRHKSFQLPTSAVNVTLLAIAAAAPCCNYCCQSIAPACTVLSSKPAARCGWMIGQTDKQTDAEMDVRPFHRPCSTYYATSVNNAMKVIIPVKDINRLEHIHRLKSAAWPSLSLIVTGSLFHMSGPQTEKGCWCNWVLVRQTIADLGADDHSWWCWDPLMWRYDTIRDAILTCAQKLT